MKLFLHLTFNSLKTFWSKLALYVGQIPAFTHTMMSDPLLIVWPISLWQPCNSQWSNGICSLSLSEQKVNLFVCSYRGHIWVWSLVRWQSYFQGFGRDSSSCLADRRVAEVKLFLFFLSPPITWKTFPLSLAARLRPESKLSTLRFVCSIQKIFDYFGDSLLKRKFCGQEMRLKLDKYARNDPLSRYI